MTCNHQQDDTGTLLRGLVWLSSIAFMLGAVIVATLIYACSPEPVTTIHETAIEEIPSTILTF